MGILKQAPWSRIRGQNSVYKAFLEIVGSGKPKGSVLKETIAVSVTISISVQNRHSRILLRALLRGSMKEMHREPEVPGAKAEDFIISDLAWLSKWSLFRSRRDLSTFDGSACLKTELLNWFPCSSLTHENIAASFNGAIGLRKDSQSSRLCIYSGEASIFCSSPSSRSESAMLSADS